MWKIASAVWFEACRGIEGTKELPTPTPKEVNVITYVESPEYESAVTGTFCITEFHVTWVMGASSQVSFNAHSRTCVYTGCVYLCTWQQHWQNILVVSPTVAIRSIPPAAWLPVGCSGTLLKMHTFSIQKVHVADQWLLCSTWLLVLHKSNNSINTILL